MNRPASFYIAKDLKEMADIYTAMSGLATAQSALATAQNNLIAEQQKVALAKIANATALQNAQFDAQLASQANAINTRQISELAKLQAQQKYETIQQGLELARAQHSSALVAEQANQAASLAAKAASDLAKAQTLAKIPAQQDSLLKAQINSSALSAARSDLQAAAKEQQLAMASIKATIAQNLADNLTAQENKIAKYITEAIKDNPIDSKITASIPDNVNIYLKGIIDSYTADMIL